MNDSHWLVDQFEAHRNRLQTVAYRMLGSLSEADAVAKGFAGRAQGARPVLVNGSVGVVVAPRGRMLFVLELKIVDGKITEIDMTADPARIRQLDLAEMKD